MYPLIRRQFTCVTQTNIRWFLIDLPSIIGNFEEKQSAGKKNQNHRRKKKANVWPQHTRRENDWTSFRNHDCRLDKNSWLASSLGSAHWKMWPSQAKVSSGFYRASSSWLASWIEPKAKTKVCSWTSPISAETLTPTPLSLSLSPDSISPRLPPPRGLALPCPQPASAPPASYPYFCYL